jgi:uncharacterized protein YndB with AHSA1/START domain
METVSTTTITVQVTVHASLEKTWKHFTSAEDVKKWNNASDDWHTPSAENDLRTGGKFVYRMEAKDGSFGFDFGGTYDAVETNKYIEYTIGDGRKVKVQFTDEDNSTIVTESFEAEQMHSIEMQRTGWQAILDNFKNYVESLQ